MLDGEGLPWSVVLADISRRTGWTFSEIDEQDASEVLPALIGQTLRDQLQRVDQHVNSHGQSPIADEDLQAYANIREMMKDG